MAAVKFVRHKDGTWTVRVGRAVENIDATAKDKTQLFDALLIAARSKGAHVDELRLAEIIASERDE